MIEEQWFDERPWIDQADAQPEDHVRGVPVQERKVLGELLHTWQRDGVVILKNARATISRTTQASS